MQAADTDRASTHSIDVTELLAQLDVVPMGDGHFAVKASPAPLRNVVEGAQLLGQSVVAATRMGGGKRVVSAHAIFSRPACFDRPLDLRVSLTREGRAFSTAAIEIGQDDKTVASVLALLDRGAGDVVRHQIAMPEVPAPLDCEPHGFGVRGRDVAIPAGTYSHDRNEPGPAEIHAWLRYRDQPADLALRQALLAQFIGRLTVAAAMRPDAQISEAMAHRTLTTGVLSLTVAFHADAPDEGWLLYSNHAVQAGGGLAQIEGRVFSEQGDLLATSTALAMLRALEGDPAAHGGFASFM